MDAQQIIGIAQTIATAVDGGKVLASEVIDFLESKGADAEQIAANRALLQSDIAEISAELNQPPASGN